MTTQPPSGHRHLGYVNHAGGWAVPKAQLSCHLCPNSAVVLAHQDPIRDVATRLGWLYVGGAHVKGDGTTTGVWICHEHRITEYVAEGPKPIREGMRK